MYNKIFTKILDSSVWLEATPTRIVWITLIAAMDEHGFCAFAAPGNVASRARVTDQEAIAALHTLESPDTVSPGQPNDGRRLERVPGGWMVLNAEKYRDLVTRAQAQASTRERVRKFREKKRAASSGDVTKSNASVTPVTPLRGGNGPVTQSEAYTDTETEAKGEAPPSPVTPKRVTDGYDPSADPLENIPEGLTLVQYADFVAEQVGIPAGYALKVKIGDTLGIMASGGLMATAVRGLIERMQAAGPQKWLFWLEDGGWRDDAGSNATEAAFLGGAN
jgi:hypothetical protein